MSSCGWSYPKGLLESTLCRHRRKSAQASEISMRRECTLKGQNSNADKSQCELRGGAPIEAQTVKGIPEAGDHEE